LNEKETVHIDEINLRSGLSSSAIAVAILNLELQNVVKGLLGKMYNCYKILANYPLKSANYTFWLQK